MEYPGGFSDEVLYPVDKLGITPEKARRWLGLAEEFGLRLNGNERAIGGPSLPFFLLLGERAEGVEGGEAFKRAYWTFVEEVLGEPSHRGSLVELLAHLGSLREEKSAFPPELSPTDPAQVSDGRKRGGEQKREKVGRRGKREEELDLPPPEWEARLEALEERIEALERQSKAHDLSLSSFAELLSRMQNEVARMRDEVGIWGEHLQFFNDRLHEQEASFQEGFRGLAKDLEEVKESLESALMQLQALRRAVTPR